MQFQLVQLFFLSNSQFCLTDSKNRKVRYLWTYGLRKQILDEHIQTGYDSMIDRIVQRTLRTDPG